MYETQYKVSKKDLLYTILPYITKDYFRDLNSWPLVHMRLR